VRCAQHIRIALVQSANSLRHARSIVGLRQFADALIDQLRYCTGAHADHRPAAGHGLDDHQAEGFAAARVHQGVGRSQPVREFHAVASIRQHAHVVAQARGTSAADQQQVVGFAQQCDRCAQHVQVLFLGEAAGKHQQSRIVRQFKLAAQVQRAPRG
jgi:hypothetical protein